MKCHRISIFIVLTALLLTLAALGGRWSQSAAQITIPTEPSPTKDQGGGGGPAKTPTPVPHYCVNGNLTPDVNLDLYLSIKPENSGKVWGGVDTPGSSVCAEAVERLCRIPVSDLPKRNQLNYYRMGMEALQLWGGKVDPRISCGTRDVYFELTGYERYMLENYPDRVGIYHYDSTSKTWMLMPDAKLDEDLGPHGRLVIETNVWGYFALGWPPKGK